MGDVTLIQDDEERHHARDLSLQRQQPPTQVPGYEFEHFLGAGAYGEVWVAKDRNTGRHVAIKFYAHRGGLDWSLLSREVDKLALLFSDRYMVQLVEVGWNADPPYYIMEYLEKGSLEERLKQGPLSVNEAVALFREVAVALVHAHGKGILHCDLKPANVLLDQDWKPRLADFGQSRLSHEQTPALGTLFYMAPEQADLSAAPDARWDVYALGALLYCMLTGHPPYRDASLTTEINQPSTLEHRLARYRKAIQNAPRPSAHKHVPGVDRALTDIIDRCLALNPSHRFPNAQAVLDALDAREIRRARLPLLITGAVGPALLLSIVSLLAWNGFHTAVVESTNSLTRGAQVGNEFGARVFADHIAIRIDRRWRILEHVADDPEFEQMVIAATGKPRTDKARLALQTQIEALHQEHREIPSVAWIIFDPAGSMIARSPLDEKTLDLNFAYRDFFHGQGRNLPEGSATKPITEVHRSIIYQSRATGQYRTVAFSVPIWSGEPDDPNRRVVGVLASSLEVGDFADFRPDEVSKDLVPVLIDTHEDEHGIRGSILIHPLLSEIRRRSPREKLPDFHVDPATIKPWNTDYRDPVGKVDRDYAGRWFAASEEVVIEGRPEVVSDTGWKVIMQERYDSAIGPVLSLRRKLVERGAITLVVIIAMLTGLWGMVLNALNKPSSLRLSALVRRRAGLSSSTLDSMTNPARETGDKDTVRHASPAASPKPQPVHERGTEPDTSNVDNMLTEPATAKMQTESSTVVDPRAPRGGQAQGPSPAQPHSPEAQNGPGEGQ